MNILFLTSAMLEKDFERYESEAKIKPNPSNQNFYLKLIKSLSLLNNVSVVSLRPLTKGMFKNASFPQEENEIDRIKFHYVKNKASKVYRYCFEKRNVVSLSDNVIKTFGGNDFIVLVDSLRFSLVKSALQLKKQHKCKVVAVLTDNPLNLQKPNIARTKKIKNMLKCFDGYISLTQQLVDNVDKTKKHIIVDGLVEEVKQVEKSPFSFDYFFFGGSLYEKYGVKTLVNNFHESSCKAKLLIAGNGKLSKYIDEIAVKDKRIVYLSQLSKNKLISYEHSALANINPRPLNDKLDKESIPSKFLEYVSSGVPTISTKHPRFANVFKNDIIWIENDIKTTLENFERLSPSIVKEKALNAKRKAFELYSLNNQSETLSLFLKTF